MDLNRVELDVSVPRAVQDEVLKNLSWISPELERVSFDPANDRALLCGCRGGSLPTAIQEQLKSVAERIARAITLLPPRVLHSTTVVTPPGCADPYGQLCHERWVVPLGQGMHAYSGKMMSLYSGLDAEFRRQALRLGVEEYKFPSLIDLRALTRAGYLAGFPHNANFVTHLPEHADAIAAFQQTIRERNDASAALEHAPASSPDAALSPTVCYHFYKTLEGRALDAEMVSGTAVSPCYRFESKATAGLRRLREFNMREIMFVGRRDRVIEARDRLIALQKTMLALCGLRAKIQSASDPFFLDTNAEKRAFQVGFDLKQEVLAHLPDDDTWLAIGSVNYHQDFFGKQFEIQLADGQPAHSCCLGFGLDRWCLAIFAQYGLKVSQWPRELRGIMGDSAMDEEVEPRRARRTRSLSQV